jgi:soluble lytic murein transglycosylase
MAVVAAVVGLAASAPARHAGVDQAGTTVSRSPSADRILRERSRPLLEDPAASLRAARLAVEQGDRRHAIWLLGQVAVRHPVVGDHAGLMQARLLYEDGHAEAAATVARNALVRAPDSPLRADLHALLGDALHRTGDRSGAQAAWRATLDESRDDALRARVLRSIAGAEEEQGLDREAATTYGLIWYAHPTSDEAAVAAHRLDLLEEYLGASLRTPTDWRRRGDRLFRARHNEEALEAYDRALAEGLSAAESRRARRQRAHTLFRLRRYPEALAAFSALPQTDDVPIWRARSMARAGQVFEAIDAFEQIAAKERGWMGIRARFLAALLLDGRDRQEQAEQHYRIVSRSSKSGGMGDAADWRLGWSAYRQGEYDRALLYFDRLIARKRGDRVGQLRPRYWRARSLEQQGDPRAAEEFGEIARAFPLSYYGWRARPRAGDSLRPPAGVAIERAPRRLSPHTLARPRILLEAGFDEAARDEVDRIAGRARGLGDRLELAQLATDAGDYNRAQRLVVDPYTETLARGPVPRHEELWWYAWPSAYAPLVDEATGRPGSVDPALVYAIMREESGYRPAVVSPVGARGLLQIMKTTGERLARSTGLSAFHVDDLFEPRTNIRLGAYYLGELSTRFDGRLSAAIASYNAGPDAVSSWPLTPPGDDDEWVESIPYDQTRSYVRRVMRSLHAYRVLY